MIKTIVIARNEVISILYRAALQINRLAYVEIASFLAMTLCFAYLKTTYNHF
jgi:hypothetical protein